ncbi:MAG: ABC transporter ATP-binding protein [Pseudomonadota bacterium]|nr:ABC transporter ATP-binding protein [Pseudomonadota bacterium]
MISVNELCKTYRKPDEPPVHALRGVSLRIAKGECVAILGPSGSGKSTLMNMLGLLDRPDSGSYSLLEREMFDLDDDALAQLRNRTIGFVFQAFHLLPRTTALENVMLPLMYAAVPNPEAKARAALASVGLADRATHFTHELSGGQQQRVAIARALVNDPELILADEPTGNLDSATQQDILDLFLDINRCGRTVVFITHSTDVAACASRVLTLRDGALVADTAMALETNV